MTIYTKDIEKYSLFQYSKNNAPWEDIRAQITCEDASKKHVALLLFCRSDAVFDSLNRVTSTGVIQMAFPIERLQEIITTLRYEKPLKVTMITDTSGKAVNACLGTSYPEPIGEQEGV